MKHYVKGMLLAGLVIVLAGSWAEAQNKNAFKVSLLSPIVRTGSFFYERMITERSSLQLGVAYTGAKVSDVRFRGLQLLPEYRFYFSDMEGPEGFYLAPFVRYRNWTIQDENGTGAEGKVQQYGGGLCAGYQALFGPSNRVALDAFLGPSFGSTSVSGNDGDGNPYEAPSALGNFGLRLGVAIGVAF